MDIVDAEHLKEEQVADIELSVIRGWLEHPETVPESKNLQTFSPEVQQLWAQCQSLQIREGLLEGSKSSSSSFEFEFELARSFVILSGSKPSSCHDVFPPVFHLFPPS